MNFDDPDLEIAAAREQVCAWLRSREPVSHNSNAELADAFTRLVGKDTTLDLRAQRNPSALCYEARWYETDRPLSDLPKPFCADSEADARVLACAALVELDPKRAAPEVTAETLEKAQQHNSVELGSNGSLRPVAATQQEAASHHTPPPSPTTMQSSCDNCAKTLSEAGDDVIYRRFENGPFKAFCSEECYQTFLKSLQ